MQFNAISRTLFLREIYTKAEHVSLTKGHSIGERGAATNAMEISTVKL